VFRTRTGNHAKRSITRAVVLAVCLVSGTTARGAAPDSSSIVVPAVGYLPAAPVVDGVLDAGLQSLPIRPFTTVRKSATTNPDFTPHYRLAYGTSFLYVFIEIDADTLVCRDRAYQNGDGFTLVVAAPRPDDAPSDEFYVLACSAVDKREMEWSRKVFWYYNVDHIFLPVSDDTKAAFHDGDGMISFELLLPWKDVHPYHPWLSESIGFNLGFVKAIGEQDVNVYKVVEDGIGNENRPRRYARLSFETPRHNGDPQTFVRLERNTVATGDTLRARAVTIAATPFTESLRVAVLAGEKTPVDNAVVKYPCGAGLTFKDLVIDASRQPAGGYIVKWRSLADDSNGESGLSIMAPFDAVALNRRLDGVRQSLAPGSYTSLKFAVQEIDHELQQLRSYETAATTRIKLDRLNACLDDAAQGTDSFARQRGFVRMAYASTRDGTLQPYVVRIPADFDPKRKYPLLVYLHGSASTERDIMGIKTIPDGFIALGPRGRGSSNWYSWDDAQTDIAEAIQSVKENFPIDDGNVFLTGFSMGGYGVYRTYYEAPKTYRAIAIFSGTPRITFAIPDGVSALDFNQKKLLASFKGVPVFVFHGKKDLNVSYKETEAFVAKLKKAGARVEFHAEDNKGHEAASDETVAAFFRWVSANSKSPSR
jgi:predicted esterase